MTVSINISSRKIAQVSAPESLPLRQNPKGSGQTDHPLLPGLASIANHRLTLSGMPLGVKAKIAGNVCKDLRLANKDFRVIATKNIASVHVSAENIDRLSQLFNHANQLQAIKIVRPHTFNDAALEKLADYLNDHSTEVKSLDLTNCVQLSGNGLRHLKKFKGLTTLAICITEMRKGVPQCPLINSVGLSHLSALTNLQSLKLASKLPSPDLGPALKEIEDLVSLEIDCANNAALRGFDQITKLKSLKISPTQKVNATGLATIAKIPALESLDLYSPDILDADLLLLHTLKNLNTLKLLSCKKITNAGLFHIEMLAGLKMLDISYCAGLDWEKIEQFEQRTGINVIKGGITPPLPADLAPPPFYL